MAARLARYRPVKVISSPSLRCTQTLEPLARGRLRVQRTDALAPDAGASAIDLVHKQIKTASADATVVLCTHREVLVELLPVLAKESGVSLGHRPPGAKGSYWTLVFDGEKLVSVKYSRPSG